MQGPASLTWDDAGQVDLVRRVRVGLTVRPELLGQPSGLLLAAVGDDEGADPVSPPPGALDQQVPALFPHGAWVYGRRASGEAWF